MKRKIISFALILSVVIGLSACNSGQEDEPIQTATGIESIKEVTNQITAFSESDVTESIIVKPQNNAIRYETEKNGDIKNLRIHLHNELKNDYSELHIIRNPEILFLSVDENSDFNVFKDYKQFSDSVRNISLSVLGDFDFSNLSVFENLQELTCMISCSNDSVDISNLYICKNIEKITFSLDSGVGSRTLIGTESLTKMNKLLEINNTSVSFDDEQILSRIPNLKYLCISWGGIKLNNIANCNQIEELIIDTMNIKKEEIKKLSRMQNLKKLYIGNCFGDFDIKEIGEIETLANFSYDDYDLLSEETIDYLKKKLPACIIEKKTQIPTLGE